MNRVLRVLLRLVTLVLSISVAIVVLGGGLWYIWQDARGRAPEVGYTITMRKLERAVLGTYLRSRGEAVTQPVDPSDTRELTFIVTSGEPVVTVAENLEEMRLIRDPQLFRLIVRYHGADGDIQAGVFTLRRNMPMEEIMRQLLHGRMPATTVTLREGLRMEEVAKYLEDLDIVPAQSFLDAVRQGRDGYSFLRDRPAGASASLEGFLFPDTYQLPQETTPARVLDILLQNWERRIPPELRQKATLYNMTLYEVVTLASIVEREAVVAKERPVIAGVYLNRLRLEMYLQADPTVQYAKGYDPVTKRWWNPMQQEEAETVKSPYNTFQRPGLPPGPICNPGQAAIQAVLEPDTHNYLFFFSRGDGSHAFAATYEEHLRNQERYGGTRKK